jgi:hypothetical protein
MRTSSSVHIKVEAGDEEMRVRLERQRPAVREIQITGRVYDVMHLIAIGHLEPSRINRHKPFSHDDVGNLNPGPSFTRSHRTLNLGRRGSEEDVRQAQRRRGRIDNAVEADDHIGTGSDARLT